MPELEGEGRFVTVARLIRPQGNRGELAAELETEDAGLLPSLSHVHLWNGRDHRELFRICESWPHKGRLILKFEGIDSIGEAERLCGWEVQIPAEQRPPAPEGSFYIADLLGCHVVDDQSGRVLGEVRDVRETGATPLLEVAGAGTEPLLIPFARAICVDIDTAHLTIRVNLPEGLEELNRG